MSRAERASEQDSRRSAAGWRDHAFGAFARPRRHRRVVDDFDQRTQRLGDAFARSRADITSGVFFAARFSRAYLLLEVFRRQRIGLVQRDDLRLVGQARSP